jgi:hypothetical protein
MVLGNDVLQALVLPHLAFYENAGDGPGEGGDGVVEDG